MHASTRMHVLWHACEAARVHIKGTVKVCAREGGGGGGVRPSYVRAWILILEGTQ